jgi:hypothetical protein
MPSATAAGYNEAGGGGRLAEAHSSSFGNRRQLRKSPRPRGPDERNGQDRRTERDSGAGPEEQLCPLRPGHGTGRPRRDGRGAGEFDTLLANDPGYTAGYFMAAQTLAAAGRTAEAIERLKAGIACAAAAAIAMLSARCRPCSTSWTGNLLSLKPSAARGIPAARANRNDFGVPD